MKKVVVLFLAFALAISPLASLADGKLKVTDKTLFVIDRGSSNYNYLFARVENIGDAPIAVDDGKLVVFTIDDDIAATESYITPYRNNIILAPGEYAYIREWFTSKVSEADLGDFKYSQPTQDLRYGRTYKQFACQGDLRLDSDSIYNDDILVTFTNTSNTLLEGFGVVVALKDASGKLVFVDGTSTSNIAIHAGSTVTVTVAIDSDVVEYFHKIGIVPTTVDAIVYAY